ncbi:hypothetical protein, partial [Chryseobacterium sp. CH1]|uniref:hypothetical protein n=1 Tax=Chryseobacterium sp. CH1 TaxID=713551 RepID=UPI0010272CAF
ESPQRDWLLWQKKQKTFRSFQNNTLRMGAQTITLNDEIESYMDALLVVKSNISSSMEMALQNSPLPESPQRDWLLWQKKQKTFRSFQNNTLRMGAQTI